MKLCHIVPSLEERHGGPSRSVRQLCAALTRLGHEVQLFATHPDASRHGDLQTDADLRITVFRREWPQRFCCSPGLRDAVKAARPDIVHHHSIWLRTLHYAHQGALRHGVPLVVSPRGMMSAWAWRHHGWRKKISRALIHPGALSGTAGWHATSEEEAAEVRGLGFTAPVVVAPNGVEAVDAAETAAARDHWHKACPDTANHRVALFYSRFHQKKRVLELIDLWLERGPKDWVLLVVGIPQEYTPESLEQYVVNMSGAGRVHVYSGAGRPSPYAAASLFLLPSHNENFGLVIAEAMAHGVPVVVTDTTPWSDVRTDGRGWCVPWSEYGDALSAATRETVAQLRARGERAQDWIVSNYSWDKAARQLAEFYPALRPTRR